MGEEEQTLEASLKSLEISTCPLPSVVVWDEYLPLEMNPFQRRPRSRSTGSISTKIKCTHRLNKKSKSNFKRNPNKLLKDPVLKNVPIYSFERKTLLKTNSCLKSVNLGKDKLVLNNNPPKARRSFGFSSKTQTDFKSLLDGCERLSIGTEYQKDSFKSARSKSSSPKCQDNRNNNSNASCSQEAIVGMSLSAPCDVTMDELASYFETFVHIPKKMSSMAEMMYI